MKFGKMTSQRQYKGEFYENDGKNLMAENNDNTVFQTIGATLASTF